MPAVHAYLHGVIPRTRSYIIMLLCFLKLITLLIIPSSHAHVRVMNYYNYGYSRAYELCTLGMAKYSDAGFYSYSNVLVADDAL